MSTRHQRDPRVARCDQTHLAVVVVRLWCIDLTVGLAVDVDLAIWPMTSVLPAAVVLVHGQLPVLDITRTTTSLGDRAFAVAGPHVWNSLPPAIRDLSLSLSVFGKLLKTYLFV